MKSEEQKTAQKKIWVVDDDPGLNEVLVESVGTFAEAKGFSSAEAMLSHLEKNHAPDLVLTDLRMPGLDGLSLMERIRESQLEIPAILLTGAAEKRDLIRASQTGIASILEKPCPTLQLRHAVTTALRSHELLTLGKEIESLLIKQQQLTKTLLSAGTQRSAQAENLLQDAGISIWKTPNERAAFVAAVRLENQGYRELEQVEKRLNQLLTRKIQLASYTGPLLPKLNAA